MEKIEKKVDFNTLVEDVSYQLVLGKGQNELVISFRNVAKAPIDTFAFCAKGYDYFNDPIESEGKKTFAVELKHLNLMPGETIKGYTLPVSKAIRKIDLKQDYVIYQDGTKEVYQNPDYKIYYFDKFFKDSYKDKKQFEALKKQNELACCYPVQNKDTWLCTCGYLNRDDNVQCKYCRSKKEEVFSTCSKEAITHLIKEEELMFYERMKQRQIERDRKETKELLLFLVKFAFVLLIIIGIVVIVRHLL